VVPSPARSSLQKLLSAETLRDDFIVNLAQNHAMTFLAERSYRQLKKTIASADKRIERLDEKAYGALTVGNWFFTPKLQQAIADSLPPQLAICRYTRRAASKPVHCFSPRARSRSLLVTTPAAAAKPACCKPCWMAHSSHPEDMRIQSNTPATPGKHAQGRNGMAICHAKQQPQALPVVENQVNGTSRNAACNTNPMSTTYTPPTNGKPAAC
jgi:hypothetical protein